MTDGSNDVFATIMADVWLIIDTTPGNVSRNGIHRLPTHERRWVSHVNGVCLECAMYEGLFIGWGKINQKTWESCTYNDVVGKIKNVYLWRKGELYPTGTRLKMYEICWYWRDETSEEIYNFVTGKNTMY